MSQPTSQKATPPNVSRGVLRREAVRMVPQPAQVGCADHSAPGSGAIAVVPLMDGDRIIGFQIRCGCGSTAVVECMYAREE